jgi:hypothetical protein
MVAVFSHGLSVNEFSIFHLSIPDCFYMMSLQMLISLVGVLRHIL